MSAVDIFPSVQVNANPKGRDAELYVILLNENSSCGHLEHDFVLLVDGREES